MRVCECVRTCACGCAGRASQRRSDRRALFFWKRLGSVRSMAKCAGCPGVDEGYGKGGEGAWAWIVVSGLCLVSGNVEGKGRGKRRRSRRLLPVAGLLGLLCPGALRCALLSAALLAAGRFDGADRAPHAQCTERQGRARGGSAADAADAAAWAQPAHQHQQHPTAAGLAAGV